jgi:ABC-type transporter Mla maintaining outer membrane lipid asymmetry permease subunit MlaE
MSTPTGIDSSAKLPIIAPIERLGASVLEAVITLGRFVLFLLSAVAEAVMPPYKVRLVLRQIRLIGAESFFLIALIGVFTGMVLGLQGEFTLRKFGSEGALGTVVSLVLVRELGPVLTALMIAARAGSADRDVRRDRNHGRLWSRRRVDGRPIVELLQRYRAKPDRR